MKESIIKATLILIWTASTLSCLGQDSTRCDPLWKARELRELAMKGRNSDKIINSQDSTIELLETSVLATHQFYWSQMADLTKQLENQKENTGYMERLALSYKSELAYYQKREKKQRRKKNVLSGALVVVITLMLIK